jgi:hypothetical protein
MSGLTRLVAVLSVTPVLALAACGGDGGGSENDDFIAEADAACTDSTREINELYAQEGTPQSFEEAVALGAKRLPISEEAVEKVSAIEAPDDLADDFDEYLAQREQYLDLLRQQQQAGEAGDQASFDQLNAELGETSDAADAAGEQVGLEACALVLPEDQVDEVTAVVEDTATTGDPAHCTEDYTENYVESSGGRAACEEGEQDPNNQLDSIEVTEVKGVDEVYAFVIATATGGPIDGSQEVQIDLVFEDGRWKIDAISPVQAEAQAGATQ